jgi:hypothetical protein
MDGAIIVRLGVGIYESSASTNLKIEGTPISDVSPSKALSALPKITGVSSPGKRALLMSVMS